VQKQKDEKLSIATICNTKMPCGREAGQWERRTRYLLSR